MPADIDIVAAGLKGTRDRKGNRSCTPPPPLESPRYICVATASNAALCQCFLPPPPLQKLPRPRPRPDITSVTVYDPEGGVELSLNPVPILTIIHGNVYTVYRVPTPRPRHRRRTQTPSPCPPRQHNRCAADIQSSVRGFIQLF